MGQLLLPLYSTDYVLITSHLAVQRKEDTVYYFHCGVPIYSHGVNERYKFRYCTSNLILQGLCRNVDIERTFKVSTDSVRRWKKVLSEQGESAFFGTKKQLRRSSKLTPHVLESIQQKLDKAQSVNSIAKGLGISEGTIRSAINKGRLKKKNK